ncbi:MAG TPA: hypothetical protein VIA63_00565 [Candidatus Limnocylindria bacterium]|jgi:hypothetical protein
MGRTAYLTPALGVAAGASLWFGLWPVAALFLAFLIGGRREGPTLIADLATFAGLAGHADVLWVALLLAATAVVRVHDPRATLVIFVAAVLALFAYVDWTILSGLLAALTWSRATLTLRRRMRMA